MQNNAYNMNAQVTKDPSNNPPDAAPEKGSPRNQTIEEAPRNRLRNYQALRGSRLRRLWLKTYIRFIKLRGEPREIALGFALGLFIATSPTMGVQMVLAIFVAALFKCSKLAAAIAVWITNPLTAPFIYGLTYVIGAKMLGLSTLRGLVGEPTLSTLLNAIKKAPELLAAMTLGGIVLGIPLAIVGYYLSYAALLKYQEGLKAKVQKQKERMRLKSKRLKEAVDLQKERIRLKKESLKKKRGQRNKARKKKKR
jgi:uncharacterized protein